MYGSSDKVFQIVRSFTPLKREIAGKSTSANRKITVAELISAEDEEYLHILQPCTQVMYSTE